MCCVLCGVCALFVLVGVVCVGWCVLRVSVLCVLACLCCVIDCCECVLFAC